MKTFSLDPRFPTRFYGLRGNLWICESVQNAGETLPTTITPQASHKRKVQKKWHSESGPNFLIWAHSGTLECACFLIRLLLLLGVFGLWFWFVMFLNLRRWLLLFVRSLDIDCCCFGSLNFDFCCFGSLDFDFCCFGSLNFHFCCFGSLDVDFCFWWSSDVDFCCFGSLGFDFWLFYNLGSLFFSIVFS